VRCLGRSADLPDSPGNDVGHSDARIHANSTSLCVLSVRSPREGLPVSIRNEVYKHRGRNAAFARAVRNGERAVDDPEVIDTRQKLAEARISRYIDKILSEAPPLNDEARRRISELLRGPHVSEADLEVTTSSPRGCSIDLPADGVASLRGAARVSELDEDVSQE
jgi:hypothetical protein